MTEKDVEVPADITVIKVPNMREAMELAVPYFYDYPGKKMRMIGVTGTMVKQVAHICFAIFCVKQDIKWASLAQLKS